MICDSLLAVLLEFMMPHGDWYSVSLSPHHTAIHSNQFYVEPGRLKTVLSTSETLTVGLSLINQPQPYVP